VTNKLVAIVLGAAAAWLVTSNRARRCGDGDLQTYFLELDKDIRLGRFEENAFLRDKRDLLVRELRDALPRELTWQPFGQGSYAIGTGIRPYNKDYDIDIGIAFDGIDLGKTDPVVLKQTVCTALSRGNRRVQIRRPCVTVNYLRDGVVDYHVDLAIYAKRPRDGALCLAMGRQHSSDELRLWSEQDPQGLVETIKGRFSGEGAKQFRRCVRYLKAWRNVQFKQGGAPSSIALTSAALHWFEPVYFDIFGGNPDDARALAKLVDSVQNQLTMNPRIELPVIPRNNLLEHMTSKQINGFLGKLAELHSTLQEAIALPSGELANAHDWLDGAFRL
jgi:hypothetical protein